MKLKSIADTVSGRVCVCSLVLFVCFFLLVPISHVGSNERKIKENE